MSGGAFLIWVLVGATAVGIYDMRVTPFSGTFPGVGRVDDAGAKALKPNSFASG